MRVRVWSPASAAAAACLTAQAPAQQLAEWRQIAEVPGFPVAIAHPPGDRLWVVDIHGRILAIENAQVLPDPVLDVSSIIVVGGESGLLGLALHPDFASNGRFYIYHTVPECTIAEYSVLGDPATSNTADPTSRRVLLTITPAASTRTHVAGWLAFGPDNYLYASVGDHRVPASAQDLQTLRGKILRIDPDGRDPGLEYAIPPSNPFASPTDPGRDEIWAFGLRNPWRCSFDRDTGSLWIGDVGEVSWEEINRRPASSPGGENYGWPCYEGPAAQGCNPAPPDLVAPIHYYPPSLGISNYVVGGHVYRGSRIPRLAGQYLYFRARQTWMLDAAAEPPPGGSIPATMLSTLGGLSYSEDTDGELYMCTVFGAPAVYTLLALPCSPADLTSGANPTSRGYAQPNGILNNDDFFYYFAEFAAGNLAVCDLTSTAVAGAPGYGVPNGVLNHDDFFYYLTIFAAGC